MVHLYTLKKVHCKEKSEYISVYDCKVVTCEGLFTSIIMHPISTVLRDTSEISLQNIFSNTKSNETQVYLFIIYVISNHFSFH